MSILEERVRVLSGDPGTKSFAITITDFVLKKDKYIPNIIYQDFFTSVLSNLSYQAQNKEKKKKMTQKEKRQAGVPELEIKEVKYKKEKYNVEGFNQQFSKLIGGIETILECYDPNIIALERFQSRGLHGPLIELITLMNTAFAYAGNLRGSETKFLMATTWKSAFARYHGVKVDILYKTAKKFKIEPHTIDSYCIGLFASPMKEPFEKLNNKEYREEVFNKMKEFQL